MTQQTNNRQHYSSSRHHKYASSMDSRKAEGGGLGLVALILVSAVAVLAVAWVWTQGFRQPQASSRYGDNGTASGSGNMVSKSADTDRVKEDFEQSSEMCTLANRDLVREAYQTALRRVPRPAELEYYAMQLEAGMLTQRDLTSLLRMTESPPPFGMFSTMHDESTAALPRLIQANEVIPTTPESRVFGVNTGSGVSEAQQLSSAVFEDSLNTQDADELSGYSGGASRSIEGVAECNAGCRPKSYIRQKCDPTRSGPDLRADNLEALVRHVFESMFGITPSSHVLDKILDLLELQGYPKDPTSSKDLMNAIKDLLEKLYPLPGNTDADVGNNNGGNKGDNEGDNEGDNGDDNEDDSRRGYLEKRDDDLYNGLQSVQPLEDMVLDPNCAWSVPQRRPPVCTRSDDGCRVCPRRDQTSLLGTLLDDATRTKVGSILPRFLYQELP